MASLIGSLQTFNQLLTAGIAITAFSLLLYALSLNLRDRVARSFAIIMICVVIVFVGEAIASVAKAPESMELWLKFQWAGIVFLPPAYLHFSDALMSTTGRPSRGRRRFVVRFNYFISAVFLLTLPFSLLVGPLVVDGKPSPHLERTTLTWVFATIYVIAMVWAWVNFRRAYQRTVTRTSRRRMLYLITGALAPALGAFPYLLFGSGFAGEHQLIFWLVADLINILVSVLLVLMAYAVAFFGVSWPDRVVKRRLFKWVMRGPVTASTVLTALFSGVFTVMFAFVPVLWLSVLLILFASWFFGMVASAANSLTLEQIPRLRGALMSVDAAAVNLGSALGAAVGGATLIAFGYEGLGGSLGLLGVVGATIVSFLAVDPAKP